MDLLLRDPVTDGAQLGLDIDSSEGGQRAAGTLKLEPALTLHRLEQAAEETLGHAIADHHRAPRVILRKRVQEIGGCAGDRSLVLGKRVGAAQQQAGHQRQHQRGGVPP